MKRRSFLLGLSVCIASDLFLPEPQVKVYSFIRRPNFGKPTLRIYSGKVPKNADTDLNNSLMLSEIPFTQKRDGSWIGTDFSADNTGIATFARMYDSNGNTILDLRGDAMGLNTRNISTGCQISMHLTMKDLQVLV